MLAEFIKKIQESYNPHEKFTIGGEHGRECIIHNGDMKIKEFWPATPDALGINTLSGVLHYAEGAEELLIHIEDYRTVHVVSKLDGKYLTRETHLTAQAIQIHRGAIGNYIPLEDFIILLMTSFVQDENITNLLGFLGNIRSEDIREDDDDGVSQKVMIKTGVTTVTDAKVPNPIELKPYMTFPEIDQPLRPFVFRMKKASDGDKPNCALFTTDNNFWQLNCVDNIRKFLAAEIDTKKIIS